jgi:hypothetical protein
MEIAKIKGKKKQKETKREHKGTKRKQTNQSEMKKEQKHEKYLTKIIKNYKKHKIGLFFIRTNKKYFNAYIRSKEYVFSKDMSELFRHE